MNEENTGPNLEELAVRQEDWVPRKLFKLFIALGMLFAAVLACDLPGAAPDPAAQFYPSHTAAVRTLEAMETANAQRATAIALTDVPSPTVTPRPAVATDTVAPTDTPSKAGTRLSQLSDGSALYSDYDGGYEIAFSTLWMPMRPFQSEYYNAWTSEQAANPDFAAALTRMQGLSSGLTRVFAFDGNLAHIQSGLVSNIVITWDPNDAMTLKQELQVTVDTYKKIQGVKIVASGTGETALKLPIAIVELSQSTKTVTGADILIYQKIVIFRARTGAAAATLTIPRTLRDPLLDIFDQALNSVTLVGP